VEEVGELLELGLDHLKVLLRHLLPGAHSAHVVHQLGANGRQLPKWDELALSPQLVEVRVGRDVTRFEVRLGNVTIANLLAQALAHGCGLVLVGGGEEVHADALAVSAGSEAALETRRVRETKLLHGAKLRVLQYVAGKGGRIRQDEMKIVTMGCVAVGEPKLPHSLSRRDGDFFAFSGKVAQVHLCWSNHG
jgi:hypothetical protein